MNKPYSIEYREVPWQYTVKWSQPSKYERNHERICKRVFLDEDEAIEFYLKQAENYHTRISRSKYQSMIITPNAENSKEELEK